MQNIPKMLMAASLLATTACSEEPVKVPQKCIATTTIPVESYTVKSGDSLELYTNKGFIRGTADFSYTFNDPAPGESAGCSASRLERHLPIDTDAIMASLNGVSNSSDLEKKLFHPGKEIFVIADYDGMYGNKTYDEGRSNGRVGTVTITSEEFDPQYPAVDPGRTITSYAPRKLGRPVDDNTVFTCYASMCEKTSKDGEVVLEFPKMSYQTEFAEFMTPSDQVDPGTFSKKQATCGQFDLFSYEVRKGDTKDSIATRFDEWDTQYNSDACKPTGSLNVQGYISPNDDCAKVSSTDLGTPGYNLNFLCRPQ